MLGVVFGEFFLISFLYKTLYQHIVVNINIYSGCWTGELENFSYTHEAWELLGGAIGGDKIKMKIIKITRVLILLSD